MHRMVTLQLSDRSYSALHELLVSSRLIEDVTQFTDVYPLMLREDILELSASISSDSDFVVTTD